MKKIVLMFTLFLAFTTISIAQTTDAQPAPSDMKKGKGRGKGHAAGMAKDLNLSADQKMKMKAVQSNFKSKMQAIRTDKSLTKEQKMAQVKELGAVQDAEIKGFLSAEQYSKWSEVKEQHKDKMKDKHKERKGKKADTEGDK